MIKIKIRGLYKINNEKLIEYINNKNKNIRIDDLMMQLAYGQMFSVNNHEKIATIHWCVLGYINNSKK